MAEQEQPNMEKSKTRKMRVYAYPLKTKDGKEYYGMYSIKEGVKPLGFEGEFLFQERETE